MEIEWPEVMWGCSIHNHGNCKVMWVYRVPAIEIVRSEVM